jgi:integrase
LDREFGTIWAKWPIQDIKQQHIREVIDAVVARGSPGAANHALAALRKFFNWAVELGHLTSSPCAGIRPSRARNRHGEQVGKSRDRVLNKTELACVWRAAGVMGWPYGHIVQLLILTGQRRNEVAGMRWSELDLIEGLWSIPRHRNKADRQHEVPLVPTAVALIKTLPRVHDKYVFPARGKKDNSASGFSRWKNELDGISGLSDWRIHDLRRTAASGMAGLQVAPHVIEKVLGHTTGVLGGVAGIYNRFAYLDEMRVALTRWAQFIDEQKTSVIGPCQSDS